MNDLVIQHTRELTISESHRVRIAAAWEALSVNSRRSYQGAWIGAVNGSLIGAYPSTIYSMR